MPFTKAMLDFLYYNKINNDKEWFRAHRAEYETLVLEPLADFVREAAPFIWKFDPMLICEAKIGKSISRIYRDTRFSADKSFFRDVMWCSFMRDKKIYYGLPGLFFELSPRGFTYGCGYYQACPEAMQRMRSLIISGDSDAKKAMRTVESQTLFTLEGDCFKKSRYPDRSEKERKWLDRKNICLIRSSTDFDSLFSPDICQKFCDNCMTLLPVYRFLLKAEEQKSMTEAE